MNSVLGRKPYAGLAIQDTSRKERSQDVPKTADPWVDGKDPTIRDPQGSDKPLDLGGGGSTRIGEISKHKPNQVDTSHP